MNESHVDARGMACPQPVLLARQAILESGAEAVRVIVDDEASSENVQRMARSLGWVARAERREGAIEVVLTKGAAAPEVSCETPGASRSGPVVLVASNVFGTGDEELGRILMRAFLKTLPSVEPKPTALIFLNSGVRLTTEGSDLLEDIRALEGMGIEVLSCGTCLDFYRLKDALRAGAVTNMFEIATRLLNAERVVRL